MCGLVGAFGGGMTSQDAKIVKQLLYVDALRGKHSTGIALVKQDGTTEVFKKALEASDFLALKKADDLIDAIPKCAAILGHNRYATMGGITADTAHPFKHGDITLTHNGTLWECYNLPGNQFFDVDSENICYAFDVDTAENIIPKLDGAFALAWHDQEASTVNFVRNDERPLWFATNEVRNVTYYASEEYMLRAILERNNVSAKYVELQVGKLVSFPITGIDTGKATVKNVELMETYNSWYYGNTKGRSGTTYPAATTTTTAANTTALTPKTSLPMGHLKLGDKIEFYMTHVEAWATNKDKGTMHGFTTTEPMIDVRSFAVETDKLAGYYSAEISGVTYTKGKESITVINPVLEELIDGDPNNEGKEDVVQGIIESKKVLESA